MTPVLLFFLRSELELTEQILLFDVLLRFLLSFSLYGRGIAIVIVDFFELPIKFLVLRMVFCLSFFRLLYVVVVAYVRRLVFLRTGLWLEGRMLFKYRPLLLE